MNAALARASYRATDRCRICEGRDLVPIVDLGHQFLSGVFPRTKDQPVSRGPLELVKCHGAAPDACGLVQLRHSHDPAEMYGAHYGYRSSLNPSMVSHLRAKVHGLLDRFPLERDDVVLDIGSNDGTTLGLYPEDGLTLIGMDPTAAKFRSYYRSDIVVVPDFFSKEAFFGASGGRRAKIVTSIAMFYDLERPMEFAREVRDILADDGIWHLEQSYLPTMLVRDAYDTICHEHLEYYELRQIQWIADRAGLRILDVTLNDVNGGSFAVTLGRGTGGATAPTVAQLLDTERTAGLATLDPYERFRERVVAHREALCDLLRRLSREGRTVFGLGASTKGNIILQYCDLGPREIPYIAEVNEEKFGCYTPGSAIPIISEEEAHRLKPDYFLVLPWHFRLGFLHSEAAFMAAGGRLIFPLPRIEVVPA